MLVDVALPLPIPRVFTYRVEQDGLAAGTRVLVPFRGRRLIGWVTGPGAEPIEPARVRAVSAVLDREPTVPAELLRLCRWVADYYAAPLGQVLRAALPTLLTDTRRPEPPVRTRRILRLTRELPSLQERDELFGRARRQRACYEAVEGLGGGAEVAHLTGQLGFSANVLRGLVARGVAEITEHEVERNPFADVPAPPPPRFELTPAQRRARDALVAAAAAMGGQGGATAGGGAEPDLRPFLLLGVTGSGKTLVYIELLREVVERQGRGAIVLVPEIALTPQTVARFRAISATSVAVLHSRALGRRAVRCMAGAAQRRAAHRGGARSACSRPLQDLGAIVVDEEHESTLQAGRGAAVPRARGRHHRARNERRGVRAGQRDAVARELAQRAGGQVPAARAARAGRGPAAAAGTGSHGGRPGPASPGPGRGRHHAATPPPRRGRLRVGGGGRTCWRRSWSTRCACA